MRVEEILRSLIDLVDNAENSDEEQECECDDQPVMTPPLQQEFEMLKKMAGIPSKEPEPKPETVIAISGGIK